MRTAGIAWAHPGCSHCTSQPSPTCPALPCPVMLTRAMAVSRRGRHRVGARRGGCGGDRPSARDAADARECGGQLRQPPAPLPGQQLRPLPILQPASNRAALGFGFKADSCGGLPGSCARDHVMMQLLRQKLVARAWLQKPASCLSHAPRVACMA